MTHPTHLHFDAMLSRQKPESIRNRSTACPFCVRDSLEEVLAEQGSILLVKNKFPVLQDTFQTVLIETDQCESDLWQYDRDHLHALLRFGVEQWMAMEATGEYRSVMFYKNHGPLSGGSLRHPHMQIVGLKHLDYRTHVSWEQFAGLEIAAAPGVELNVSTLPRVGFFEWNAILRDREQIDVWADYIQVAVDYMMNHFNVNCTSYNLFFYELDGTLVCKIVPRFPTSPLFVGFSIPQVPQNLGDHVQAMQKRYF
jgi:ATP adenylyltransferase/5',5'''-P-1,P-4-tetraphosphate phosphorylase II